MDWVLVPITLGCVVLTGLSYRKLKAEHNAYFAANVQDAFMKGSAAGLVLGIVATLTSSMVIDTIVRLVK